MSGVLRAESCGVGIVSGAPRAVPGLLSAVSCFLRAVPGVLRAVPGSPSTKACALRATSGFLRTESCARAADPVDRGAVSCVLRAKPFDCGAATGDLRTDTVGGRATSPDARMIPIVGRTIPIARFVFGADLFPQPLQCDGNRFIDTGPGRFSHTRGPLMFDILGVIVLLALVALGIWLARKARRARNRAVKWVGLVLSTLLAAVCTLATGISLVGFYKINFPRYKPAVADVKVAATPEQLARGAKLAIICASCHSTDGKLPLAGRNFMEGGPPVGTMYATNLTPGGEIRDWSDGEVIRAIREGIHKSGRALLIMPSEIFHNLSDDDVRSVVAYLRSQPAAGQNTPPTRLNVLGALLFGAGIPTSAQPPITGPVVAPAEGVSADYGKYLVSVVGCHACHGENLAGRKTGGFGPPGGPNLTVILPNWSAEDFMKTLRTGVDPSNHALTQEMPWKRVSTFASDDDLRAMYAYLHSLAPITTATR
jgi:mono/diheme cytochrome c family protein